MVVNWRKRGTEKHNGQGGESIQQPRRRPSGSRTEISAKFRRGTDIFRKSKLPCSARHGGESCSRWTASGAISGKARGEMHHLGAGTVKSGGGDSFADGDDVVTINPFFYSGANVFLMVHPISFLMAVLTLQDISALKPRERPYKPFCVQHDRKYIMRRKAAHRGAGGATGALLSIAFLFFFGTKGHYPELCKHHIPPRGWEQAYIKKMMWGRCTHPLPVNMLFSTRRITIGFTVYVFNNIAGLTVQ